MPILRQNFHQHNLKQFGIYGGRIREILTSFNYYVLSASWGYSGDQVIIVWPLELICRAGKTDNDYVTSTEYYAGR